MKITLTVAAAFCISAVSQAQTDWTGFYLGVNAGHAEGRSTTATDAFPSTVGYYLVSSNWDSIHASGTGTLKPAGIIGGITAGFNWQHGHGVAGLEVDHGRSNANARRTITTIYPIDNLYGNAYAITQRVDMDAWSTLRLRGGYASGRWLIYGTAGVAQARFNFQEEFGDDVGTPLPNGDTHESGGVSGSRRAFVWGGGVEFRFAGNWSVKAEYLRTNFGTLSGRSDNLIVLGEPFPVNYFTYSADLKLDVMRLGVNYRF